jgi:hypothetical protein
VQPIPTNDNLIGYIVAGLFALLTTLIGLVVWLFKNELGRIREHIHAMGNYINTVLLEAIKAIGRTKKDE